jgi:hypothetical protein
MTPVIKGDSMNSNNPADWHDLKHFSAHQMNLAIHSPALWLARVAGFKSTVGASAFRGTAIGIAAQILGTTGDKEVAILAADEAYKEELKKANIPLSDSKAKKEHKVVTDTTAMLANGGWCDKVDSAEKKIELTFDEVPIPIIGYVDMICPDKLIELKSKAIATNKLDAAANMQAAIYQEATGLPAEVYYTSPKGMTIFKVDHAAGINRAKKAAQQMLNILSLSTDAKEIIRLYFHPNPDDWRVGEAEMQFFNSIIGD